MPDNWSIEDAPEVIVLEVVALLAFVLDEPFSTAVSCTLYTCEYVTDEG